jgi:hypothetical protein
LEKAHDELKNFTVSYQQKFEESERLFLQNENNELKTALDVRKNWTFWINFQLSTLVFLVFKEAQAKF